MKYLKPFAPLGKASRVYARNARLFRNQQLLKDRRRVAADELRADAARRTPA